MGQPIVVALPVLYAAAQTRLGSPVLVGSGWTPAMGLGEKLKTLLGDRIDGPAKDPALSLGRRESECIDEDEWAVCCMGSRSSVPCPGSSIVRYGVRPVDWSSITELAVWELTHPAHHDRIYCPIPEPTRLIVDLDAHRCV